MLKRTRIIHKYFNSNMKPRHETLKMCISSFGHYRLVSTTGAVLG